MKESFYFRHDYSARNDEKILELRAEFDWRGYGIYWAILEIIGENDKGGINRGAIGGLSVGLNLPKDELQKILDFCIEIGLFIDDNGFIHSKRFDEHLNFRLTLSNAGKEGAEKRWNKNRVANGEAIATPMQRKEQNSKEKNIPLGDFDLKTDYKQVTKKIPEYLWDNLTDEMAKERMDVMKSELLNSFTFVVQVGRAINKTESIVKKEIIDFVDEVQIGNDRFGNMNDLKEHFRKSMKIKHSPNK